MSKMAHWSETAYYKYNLAPRYLKNKDLKASYYFHLKISLYLAILNWGKLSKVHTMKFIPTQEKKKKKDRQKIN